MDDLDDFFVQLDVDINNPKSDFYRGGMSDWLATLQPKMERAYIKKWSSFEITGSEKEFIKNFLMKKYNELKS